MESPTTAAAELRTAELHVPAARPEPARPVKKVKYGQPAFDPLEMVSPLNQLLDIQPVSCLVQVTCQAECLALPVPHSGSAFCHSHMRLAFRWQTDLKACMAAVALTGL